MQNLIYALIQLIHNFGAAAVIGIPVYVLMTRQKKVMEQHRFVVAVALAWLLQLVTGFSFGIVSLTFYGHLPDIHGVARIALLIKIICAITALAVIFFALKQKNTSTKNKIAMFWVIWLILGATALSSAAFLRWYS